MLKLPTTPTSVNRATNIVAKGDLQNLQLIYLKGAVFLLIGLVSAVLLILENLSFRFAALVGITISGFCRCYYFAFYVIEHCVDPSFRFSGLLDFARYLMGHPRR